MPNIPIQYGEYKEMNKDGKRDYIRAIAEYFHGTIKKLGPIDGSEIFIFGGKLEFVDLDLPSGTKWASCNLSCSLPEENARFAWAGREPGNNFTLETCPYYNLKTNDFTRYNDQDNYTELLDEDNAAKIILGDAKYYDIPTMEDFDELLNNTSMTPFGNFVRFVSKKNENYIDCYYQGFMDGENVIYQNSDCYFWTKNLYSVGSSTANAIYLNEYGSSIGDLPRQFGLNIRPIRRPK